MINKTCYFMPLFTCIINIVHTHTLDIIGDSMEKGGVGEPKKKEGMNGREISMICKCFIFYFYNPNSPSMWSSMLYVYLRFIPLYNTPAIHHFLPTSSLSRKHTSPLTAIPK